MKRYFARQLVGARLLRYVLPWRVVLMWVVGLFGASIVSALVPRGIVHVADHTVHPSDFEFGVGIAHADVPMAWSGDGACGGGCGGEGCGGEGGGGEGGDCP